MYDTQIQTTVSILGHLVFIEYIVTEEWAIEWYLTDGAYPAEDAVTAATIDLFDVMLRAHYSEFIEQRLLSEFEERRYAEEQKLAANLEDDVAF